MVIESALDDPVALFVAGTMLLLVFLVYLYFRRVVVSFREGLEDGK